MFASGQATGRPSGASASAEGNLIAEQRSSSYFIGTVNAFFKDI
jgi:hypothetical protein